MNIEIKDAPLSSVWSIRRSVMYPDFSLQQVQLKEDPFGRHLGLYVDGGICSVVSLFQIGNTLQFRKFATVTERQGKGFGTALLQAVFNDAKQKGINFIWCNARTTAIPFYQKFGMTTLGTEWEENGHRFIKMQIEL